MNENGMNNKRNVNKWNQGREEIEMTPKKRTGNMKRRPERRIECDIKANARIRTRESE